MMHEMICPILRGEIIMWYRLIIAAMVGGWISARARWPIIMVQAVESPERDVNNMSTVGAPGVSTREAIRAILVEHARLSVPVVELGNGSDLFEAGLTSLTTVNVMLALEDRFDVEFTDRMLGRRTFGSIDTLAQAIDELRAA